MPTIPDSNVVLDIIFLRREWMNWSMRWFDQSSKQGPMVMNTVIFAESTSRFHDLPAALGLLKDFGLVHEDMTLESAYLAGRAHQRYLKSGGARERVLPDFLIGAHAASRGYSILTRDASRYRTYFPQLNIIAPDTHP